MDINEELAEAIFPNVNQTIEDLEKKYPPRNLQEGVRVTRFAPSPTGFLHTGSLFTAMVAYKVAKDSKGVFYMRLEDTDTKREIAGSGELLVRQLEDFNLTPDEGYFGAEGEKGIYGPYKQSDRKEIYETVIKEMIRRDQAYPCFASETNLTKIREEQNTRKEPTGYYGKYAIYRDLNKETALKRIKEGKPFVIRFKSHGDRDKKIRAHDEVRGDMILTQNDQDVIILKSDGLPTYHFAHIVDDHFMHTTIVTRGEEWISSLPIHLEMFFTLGWKAPRYAHLPVIMKMDHGVRRKLSKRKDPEASVDYFLKEGYEPETLLVYLMTIANSNFEDYVVTNKDYSIRNFKFSLKKMSLDGALFDINKLNFFGKEMLAKMDKKTISEKSYAWAKKFSPELKAFIEEDPNRYEEILNIEREKKNPRKDYAKYSDIYDNIRFFSRDEYMKIISAGIPRNPSISLDIVKKFLTTYKDQFDLLNSEGEWFEAVKTIAEKFGFDPDNKDYATNHGSWIGSIDEACEIIRLVAVGRNISPNLYSILKIMGKEEFLNRVDICLKTIE
jgi:glutamyl-tRNA synthetase